MATAGIFDPRRGMVMTPEQIERRRRIADALIEASSQPQPIQHWTQGAAQVMQAIRGVVEQKRAERAEQANTAYNADQTKSWFGGSDFPAAPAAQAQIAATNPAPQADAPTGDYFGAIRAAESGGNDAARNPTSSAAGRYQFIDSTWNDLMRKYPELGLTADGRMDPQQQEKAIRAFTRDNAQALAGAGIDATPGNLYAAHFLGAGGARNVLSGDDASPVSAYVDAGVIKANPFLRNMTVGDFRNWAGRKGGGGTAPVDFGGGEVANAGPMTAYRDPMVSQSPAAAAIETQTPPQQAAMAPPLPPPVDVATPPAQPVNEAQLLAQAIRARGGNPQAGILPVITGEPGQTGMASTGPNMQALMGAMADPRLTEGNKRIAEILIRQQLEQQQAARELAAQQAAKQAEWARQDARYKVEDGRAERDFGLKREEFDFRKNDAARTSDIKEYEYAKERGYQGSFPDYQVEKKKAGAQNINMGTIPPGYQLVTDPVTNAQRMEPIPGSPVANANSSRDDSRETMSSVITTAAERAREAMTGATLPTDGGLGRALGTYLPGTGAAEVRRQTAVLKSNATIENLNAMRRESPTGGALGNVTEGEGAMLAAKAGALDPDSPNFARDLDDYERTLLRTIHGKDAGDAIYEKGRETSAAINGARKAIAKGAPRDAVIQRLRDSGIDPAGL